MKKQYLLMAAFASALAFTACTNDDAPFTAPGEGEGSITEKVVEGATFEIALSTQGEGTTKAVRPMGSSAADNNVNAIVLRAYKWDNNAWSDVTDLSATGSGDATTVASGKVAFKYISGDAVNTEGAIVAGGVLVYEADVDESAPGDMKHITKKAKVEVLGIVADAQYQFIAYGYNDVNGKAAYPYGTAPVAASSPFQNGVFQAGIANMTTAPTDYALEEIFAANDMGTTTTNEKNETVFTVSPSLTLTRQVAGILAYFHHIPAYLQKYDEPNGELYKVKKLQVVASHTAKDFYFPAMLLENPDFNCIADANNGEDILMTFDFSKIATNYTTAEESADTEFTFSKLSESAENDYKAPYADGYETYAPTGIQLVDGSIFGARYIIPYDQHYYQGEQNSTLVLRFLGENDELLEQRDITTNQVPEDGDEYLYDIRCNNFYSIGQKLATGTTDGPEDNPDPDEPIDLRNKNINVRINDAWAVLHNMGVDNIE